MPKVIIKKTVGRSFVANTVRNIPRQTLNQLSKELKSHDWYEEVVTASRGAAIRQQAIEAGDVKKYEKPKIKHNTHARAA